MVHKNVKINFLGSDEDSDLYAQVKDGITEMIIDIQDRHAEEPHLIRGELRDYYFEGFNEYPTAKGTVHARWACVGDVYVGLWIENSVETLFKFQIPRPTK